jgi:DNA-binding NtrC family response regulator
MSVSIPEFIPSIVDAGFIPEEKSTKELYREVAAFASQGQPIVIFGPTGAGKEFLARHYYNTLISTEFYQQNREKWPERYREIKTQYSGFYSGKNLDVFLKSIRAGVFQAVNSTTIYPSLAESILFGHEEGSFTGATKAHPGLLESIKYGVLFLDEIGDFPRELQVKLLRAVDSEINQGRRIEGEMEYSLKDLIIICATNQPRNRIREDFYYRLGMEVNLKGIDERPKDVLKSIPHFICNAIGKRKDYAAIINTFGIRRLSDVKKISETEEIKSFAREMTGIIADEILARSWPGNFRALRNTLEASIFRIEKPVNPDSFTLEFRNYLHYYISQYSNPLASASQVKVQNTRGLVFPSAFPEMDRNILEEFERRNILNDLKDNEKIVLAVFLSTIHAKGFRRKDLEDYYKKNDSIKFFSEAHIRNRINILLSEKILVRTGSGKSTRYEISGSFRAQVSKKRKSTFSIPCAKNYWTWRNDEINIFEKVLNTTERVYIQAPQGYGKTSFIAMFCEAKKQKYNFYYYALGQSGITELIDEIVKNLQSDDPSLDLGKSMAEHIKNITPFLDMLFKSKGGFKPVLIIDQAHFVSDIDKTGTIVEIARRWKNIIMVLAGDTMDNALEADFFEFTLSPWGKEA